MEKKNKNKCESDGRYEEGITLFRNLMQDVTPLKASEKITHKQKHIPMTLHLRQQNKNAALENPHIDPVLLEIGPGDGWSYLRPGISRQTLRRLRKGYWKIQADLDLHGYTRKQAHSNLAAFLESCSDKNLRCVRIIHGKGLSTKNHEPILKSKVGNWIVRHNNVLAFCQARPEDGGSGAILVLLQKNQLTIINKQYE